MLVTLSDYEGFADYSLYRPCPPVTIVWIDQDVSQAMIGMGVMPEILIFINKITIIQSAMQCY